MDTTRVPRIGPVALLAAAALAFLLPFGTVSCNGETVSFTGVELATSRIEPDSTAPDQGLAGDVEDSASGSALAALALILGGLASAGWRGRGGGFAAGAMVFLLFLLIDAASDDYDVQIRYGFWLAFAAVGATCVVRFAAWRGRRGEPPVPRSRLRRAGPGVALTLGVIAAAIAVGAVTTDDRTQAAAGPSEVDFTTADWAPAWSPDGRRIAFASSRGAGGIFTAHADGSCIRRVTAGNEIAWSPDGRRLAVTRGDGADGTLLVMDANGRSERTVARGGYSSPSWSRDDRRLYAVRSDVDPAVAYAVTVETSRIERLAPPWVRQGDRRWSPAAASEVDATVSPDGRRYAFESSDDPTVGIDALEEAIFVRTVGRAGRRQLSDPPPNAGDYEPAWSPDGGRIAFQRSGEVAVMNADGSGARVLTNVGGATEPAWSPDGGSIVFARALYGSGYGSDPSALEIVDVETGRIRKLTWGPEPLRPCRNS